MNITIKTAKDEDLKECLAIEKAAMAGHQYLEEVWDYFKLEKGGSKCVLADGKIVGFGRYTVLYDGSGWLEALRVDPAYQGQGVGSAIYEDYMEQAKAFGSPSMAMGTNPKNIASSHLAEKFGLFNTGIVRTYNLTDFAHDTKPHDFSIASCNRAAELIMPDAEKYNGYIVLSGTCFPFNEKTIRGFASDGKIYEDEKSGSYILCSSRFLHEEALYIGLMSGDYKKCIDFAKRLAKAQGIKTLSCSFAIENPMLQKALDDNGFEKHFYEWIIKEAKF